MNNDATKFDEYNSSLSSHFFYIYIYYNHFLEHILNLNYKTLSKKVEAKELCSFTAILC